jgi:hypothetical protein
MITTIIGDLVFHPDHVFIVSVQVILKTEEGPSDLTLASHLKKISLVKGTLPIQYDSKGESQLKEFGILEEVKNFNKSLMTVIQGYRNELFKFDTLPKGKDKLDWLSEMRNLKAEFFAHIHKCHMENLQISIEVAYPILGFKIHEQPLKGRIIQVDDDDDIHLENLTRTLIISLDSIISLTYGG